MTKKQLSRRDFIKITGMAAAAGLLASCQPKATEVPKETDAPDVSPPEPEAIEIVHWVEHYLLPDLEDFKEYQDAAMDAYHEKYPNVTVIAEDPFHADTQSVILCTYTCGDANRDGVINVGDVVYLVSYLYKNGPEPLPAESGDCNRDQNVDVGDVVDLVNYLYKNGSPPCES